jgi:hypothetical protein
MRPTNRTRASRSLPRAEGRAGTALLRLRRRRRRRLLLRLRRRRRRRPTLAGAGCAETNSNSLTGLDRSAQHVAGGQVAEAVLVLDDRRLSALAAARRANEDDVLCGRLLQPSPQPAMWCAWRRRERMSDRTQAQVRPGGAAGDRQAAYSASRLVVLARFRSGSPVAIVCGALPSGVSRKLVSGSFTFQPDQGV